MTLRNDPFKLTIEMLTPFVLGQHALTLDGLLSAAIFRATGKMNEDTIPEIPLVRESVGGFALFHASSCHYPQRHAYENVSRVMSLRSEHDLAPTLFAPNRRDGSYGHVDQKRGPYKSNLDSYPAINCREVYFWGVGDGERCAQLVRHYIVGIGRRANAGAGQIGAVNVEPDDDYSWVTLRGTPARPLPKTVWEQVSDSPAPTMPLAVDVPYYRSPRVEAVFPTSLVC